MKDNYKLGAILAAAGMVTGLLILLILAGAYTPNIAGKIAEGRPDEAVTVRIVFALLGWLGVAAGALWTMVLYGFLNKARWAWGWGVVAASLQILCGFFPMIPAASIDLPTPTAAIFVLAFVWWFGMLLVGGVDKRVMALAFASGLAYVLTFIDGVGAISRYQTVPEGFPHGMYGLSQMVNWWGAAAWVVFIYALVKGKTWAPQLGVFAAAMSIFGGYPVGLTDVIRLGRFSMFLAAPVIATILLVVFLLPGTQRLMAGWSKASH